MTLLLLAAILATAWWVIASPLRIGAAGAAWAAAHVAPASAAVVLGLLLASLGAVILVRSLQATGGGLILTTKPLIGGSPR